MLYLWTDWARELGPLSLLSLRKLTSDNPNLYHFIPITVARRQTVASVTLPKIITKIRIVEEDQSTSAFSYVICLNTQTVCPFLYFWFVVDCCENLVEFDKPLHKTIKLLNMSHFLRGAPKIDEVSQIKKYHLRRMAGVRGMTTTPLCLDEFDCFCCWSNRTVFLYWVWFLGAFHLKCSIAGFNYNYIV